MVAGPFAGFQLAALGADVIRVEPPDATDPARHVGRGAEAGMGALYRAHNAGKRAVALDLKSPADRARLLDLIADADILIENFRAGALARLGLGYDDLAPHHPRLIYCSITGFGQTGSAAGLRAYDNTVQAATGLMALNGDADTPRRIGVPVVDVATGLTAALAILAACLARTHTGRGQHVDVSMASTALTLAGAAVLRVTEDAAETQTRAVPANPGLGTYRTARGQLTLGAMTTRQQALLARVLGIAPDRLATGTIAQVLAQHDADDWMRRLQHAGLPAQRVLTLAEAVTAAPDLTHVDAGPGRAPRSGFRLSGVTPAPLSPAPRPPLPGVPVTWIAGSRPPHQSERTSHVDHP